MKEKKQEIVTFKADQDLLEAMSGIPNRSQFIRTAILSALDNVCPLCKGTGILTPCQQRHWGRFARTHKIKECEACNQSYLTCAAK